MAELVFRVEETKTGEPLELPIPRQLAAILERRNRESETLPGDLRGWVFPSSAKAGHIEDLSQFYARIGTAGRCEVLVPRTAELFHYRRRARPAAAAVLDQTARQPRTAQRRHRRLRRRLDHRATAGNRLSASRIGLRH